MILPRKESPESLAALVRMKACSLGILSPGAGPPEAWGWPLPCSQHLAAFCSSHRIPLCALKRVAFRKYCKADNDHSGSLFSIRDFMWKLTRADRCFPLTSQTPKAKPHTGGLLSTCHMEGLLSLTHEFCFGFCQSLWASWRAEFEDGVSVQTPPKS